METVYKNRTVYILLVLALGYLIYIVMNKKNEGVENVYDEKTNMIAKKVYKYYMDKDNFDFVDYINYLTSIGNTNLELIELEVFYELKSLKKKGTLTLENVLNEMNKKPTNNTNNTNNKEKDGQRLKDNTALMKSILQPYVI